MTAFTGPTTTDEPPTDMPRKVEDMSMRAMLEELVMFTRDVQRGMEEFYAKMHSNPILRMFGG